MRHTRNVFVCFLLSPLCFESWLLWLKLFWFDIFFLHNETDLFMHAQVLRWHIALYQRLKLLCLFVSKLKCADSLSLFILTTSVVYGYAYAWHFHLNSNEFCLCEINTVLLLWISKFCRLSIWTTVGLCFVAVLAFGTVIRLLVLDDVRIHMIQFMSQKFSLLRKSIASHHTTVCLSFIFEFALILKKPPSIIVWWCYDMFVGLKTNYICSCICTVWNDSCI